MILVLGWFAVGLYLADHAYLSLRQTIRWPVYYSVNLVAALAFVVSSAALLSWQSVFINAFWAIVSILALVGVTLRVPATAGRVSVVVVGAMAVIALPVMIIDLHAGFEIAGWAGSALYCIAYFLLAQALIKRPRFLVLNAAAAILLIPIYWVQGNWPAVGMSVSWATVSVVGLARRQSVPAGGVPLQ